jgi:uncharacterized protein (DUF2147 family)
MPDAAHDGRMPDCYDGRVEKRTRPELVFVVRMWLQGESGSEDGSWRGSIQDVNSGKRFYVVGTHDVSDFIDARLNEAIERT